MSEFAPICFYLVLMLVFLLEVVFTVAFFSVLSLVIFITVKRCSGIQYIKVVLGDYASRWILVYILIMTLYLLFLKKREFGYIAGRFHPVLSSDGPLQGFKAAL